VVVTRVGRPTALTCSLGGTCYIRAGWVVTATAENGAEWRTVAAGGAEETVARLNETMRKRKLTLELEFEVR
jgi:hypothetical protein